MASNSIKIYDDTVIKLSINQGLEEQRSNEILGNFTNGELAYTRDTARLFVGDNSDGEAGHIGLQETIGGSLVGNKYLGLIDSKPLVTFTDNGEPLSFENPTSSTGTQELTQLSEQGLLTAQSKFRLHSKGGASEKWDNWDRTAVYNPKYNAYNGDFMYDIYQNALILFDTHISGKADSPTQPQIVKGLDGQPVEPETFIVNGKQIRSDSVDAVGLTRRTILQNYSKTNQDSTNSELVYGDGYVVMRMVEPDNQTIRFKRKSFQRNGLPTTENNYTHNILEVFNVPLETFKHNFNDDFIINDKVTLNKDISNVKSITGVNNVLKIPKNLAFSTSNNGGRGATTFLEWSIQEPLNITLPNENTYKLVFKPEQSKKTDGSKQYLSFKAELEEEKPYAYTINLSGGLESNQENRYALVIDERATYDDITQCPTLTIGKIERDVVLYHEDDDPYYTDKGVDLYYSGNLGIDETGIVMEVDSYSDSYYLNAQKQIDKWTEKNTSVNYLKTPVTILQSSTSPTLYTKSNTAFVTNKYNFPGTANPTASTTQVNDDFDKLAALAKAPNTLYVANNKGTAAVSGVTWNGSNKTLTVTTAALTTNGFSSIITGPNLTNKVYLESATVTGQVTGLTGGSSVGTIRLFLALINNGKVIKSQERNCEYKAFSFGFDITFDEVIVTGTNVFLALGVISTGKNTGSANISFKDISYTTKALSDEEIFTLCDAGVNVSVDFNVSPYLFCARKTVSTPNNFVLPRIETIQQYPNNLQSNYFTSFASSALYNKTWNNFVSVLGHNHYKNLSDSSSSIPLGRGGSSLTKKAAILYINSFDVQKNGNAYSIKTHTALTDGEEESMAFSWYKEYDKDGSGKEINAIYYPHEAFELRTEGILEDYTRYINYVKVQDNNTNLIDSRSGGVVTGPEEKLIVGEDPSIFRSFRRRYAIYLDSSLLSSGLQEGIEFGLEESETVSPEDAIANFYDFTKYKDYDIAYDLYIDEEVARVAFVKNSGTNVIKTFTEIETAFPSLIINVDSTVPGTSEKVSAYDYIVFILEDQYQEAPGKTPVTVEYYEAYKILKNIPYLTGFEEPKALGNQPVVINNTSITTVNLDETLDEEDKVYIPTTARNIILELTHITTENNTIGVSYANEFDDLGLLLPGLPVQEYNNPATFSADIIINPSHNPTVNESAYVNTSGKYKMKMGKTNSTSGTTQFHDLNQTVAVNKTRVPSIYAAAPNEKILCNSSATETRIFEVPLHKVPGTYVRHFALRIANIRPSTAEILNQVVLRVIGYRT